MKLLFTPPIKNFDLIEEIEQNINLIKKTDIFNRCFNIKGNTYKKIKNSFEI